MVCLILKAFAARPSDGKTIKDIKGIRDIQDSYAALFAERERVTVELKVLNKEVRVTQP